MFMRKLTSQALCDLDAPVVETKEGKLRGVYREGTYIFRGIKYAEARRFHAPVRVTSWEGVRSALVYGPVCHELNTHIAHDNYYVPHFYYPQSEDCLYLNIWTQQIDPDAGKPVMVWLHGGGFHTGSSIELMSYDGENLSAFGDVVVVSLNHRLNLLGFLDLSAYGEAYRNSANRGMEDLLEGLRWIRDNIAAFGGDPNNITLFGQSGGGAKACDLMQMPMADGLYHRVIMQSGGAGPEMRPGITESMMKEARQALAAGILEELNLSADEKGVETLERVDWYDLVDAAEQAMTGVQQKSGIRPDWGPLPDGEFFLGHPLIHGFREETREIPMMVGNVYAETQINYAVVLGEGSKNEWDEEKKARILKERFGDRTEEILSAFRKAYPGRNLADSLFIGTRMRRESIDFCKARAKVSPGKIWNWQFDLEGPFYGGVLPWHNAEEPFVFHNVEYIEASFIPGVSEKLQDAMCEAWVRFAKTGDPNHPGLPVWESVSPDRVPTMLFDRECTVAVNHDRELLPLLPPELPRRKPRTFNFENVKGRAPRNHAL